MSSSAGRVFTSLTRASLSRVTLIHDSTVRVNSVRPITLSSQKTARSKKPTDDSEVNNEPIKFSTSKASHRTWSVDSSMGGRFERPWWKVLPLSLFATGLLLWCALRMDIQVELKKQLYQHIPGLLSEKKHEDEEQEVNKSS